MKRRLVICIVLLLAATGARADGGAVRLAERLGTHRITVFTAPTPVRAGLVDISVLVQDARTGAPAPELPVTIRLVSADHEIAAIATRATATNKLFQAAQVEVPAAGRWRCEVKVGDDVAGFDLDVEDALPAWTELWFWLVLPAFVAGVFVLRQFLPDSSFRARRRAVRAPA